MTIVLDGSAGITNDGGYTGDGVVFADTTPANTLVTTTGGNVGIGTGSPVINSGGKTVHLHASGANQWSLLHTTNGESGAGGGDGAIYGMIGSDGYVFNYEAGNLIFGTSSAERARIDSAGHFVQAAGCRIYSIGTYNLTTAAAANLNVDGNGTFFRSTSALKYKKDIRDLESIDVNAFRAVRYKSKSESDDQTKDHFGIVADEVHAAGISELVNYGVDGEVEGFQYERLTVVLLKHCQEQQAIITALTARVAALEGTSA